MPAADRYGLSVSTSSAAALEQYQEGVDRLLSCELGAETAFAAALEAEPAAGAPAGLQARAARG